MRAYTSGFALLGLMLFAFAAGADESKVELGDVPKAGVEAVKAMFPGATIAGAAKETDEGKTVFEVTLKQNGRNIDVTVGTDGKIQLIEREIAQKELPAAVKQTLETKYPKATYKIVEQVDAMKNGKPTLDFYEAQLVTAEKQTIEVQVAPDGKIKAEETKKPGDKD
jgi:hypothetical protein